RHLALQLEVEPLRAADEAHARQAVAPGIERAARGRDQLRMAREAEVVVGAEIQDGIGAALHADLGTLRPQQRPLLLEETLLAHLPQLGQGRFAEPWVHARTSSAIVFSK